MLRVLHLASGNRWTGAAAPAFADVEALRAAGVDAHYGFVGGYKLEAKIRHHDFVHPLIEKAQNPISFTRTVNAITRLVRRHGFDFIHAHLTWDHWLARFAARGGNVRIARTFHARRVLRTDVFTRSLIDRTSVICVVNDAFRSASAIANRNSVFTPPARDLAQFVPEGEDARPLYGIAPDAKLITVIGKIVRGRGFEAAIETFAHVRRDVAEARMMIIGHGEHRAELEQLAASHGVENDITWAGYHEDDLAAHYRASDVLLFTARGSDEGHRAVLEAMACGVIPATFPLEGITALLGRSDLVASAANAESLAQIVTKILANDLAPLRRSVWQRAQEFGYEKAAERLIAAYSL
jgi:glycosyltransferase involved in cell wall biosynthesis